MLVVVPYFVPCCSVKA